MLDGVCSTSVDHADNGIHRGIGGTRGTHPFHDLGEGVAGLVDVVFSPQIPQSIQGVPHRLIVVLRCYIRCYLRRNWCILEADCPSWLRFLKTHHSSWLLSWRCVVCWSSRIRSCCDGALNYRRELLVCCIHDLETNGAILVSDSSVLHSLLPVDLYGVGCDWERKSGGSRGKWSV